MSIRGSSSTQVAVYLAGVPLTGGADPTLDLATLPLWPGARARVYRSFAPAALGPGSLGGTLVIDPPSVSGEDRSEVWAAAGSFGALRMRVGEVRAVGDGGGRVAAALSASRADDDYSYFDPNGVLQTRQNAGHAAVNGLVAWTVPVRALGDTAHLTVTTLAQSRRQHLPGPLFNPTPNQVLESDRELSSAELTVPSGRGAWSVRTWGRHDGLHVSDEPLTAAQPTHTADAIAALGGGAGWRGRPVDDVTLEARLDASGEHFAPGAWIGATVPPSASRASAGLASDLEWRATESFTATASGRLDAWSDRGDTSRDDLRPTGHVGGEVLLGPIALASHAGALSRAPSFVERFGNRGGFLGNPGLVPEAAVTVDLGARTSQKIGRVSLQAELAGFATWADDLIVFVLRGANGVARPENIGRARLAGAEALLMGRGFGLEIRAVYTGLVTANEADDACLSVTTSHTCERPPLPGRPAHDFVSDVSYGIGPARIRYGLDVVAGITADLTGSIEVPPRALHSAGIRFDVPGLTGLRLALDVRNLTDQRQVTYDDFGGPSRKPLGDQYEYPLPGRSVLVSARFLSGP